MKQILHNRNKGRVEVRDLPEPLMDEYSVKIRTLTSAISPGTERSKILLGHKGILGKAIERPDLVKMVIKKAAKDGIYTTFGKVRKKLDEKEPLGYSLCGIVLEIGKNVKNLSVGDFVTAGGAGYANHAEVVVVPAQLVIRVPKNISIEEAPFTTIGAISLQGIRQANPKIGEIFLVFGLGLVGQITTQILLANGCKVLVYDIQKDLVNLAKKFGAIPIKNKKEFFEKIDQISNGMGIDGSIITAGSKNSEPIDMSAQATREKGRIIALGNINLKLDRKLFYDKEIDFKVSRSYGPGRYDPDYENKGHDYPYGYVRFTERRNMETFLHLVQTKKVLLEKLITHKYRIEEATNAYKLLSNKKKEPCLGVLIYYPKYIKEKKIYKNLTKNKTRKGSFEISFLGAGNYATSKLIPILKGLENINLGGVCNRSGIRSREVAKKFGFNYYTDDIEKIIKDSSDIVFIATRHNLHSKLAIKSLRAKKNVFVEKPLSISSKELLDLIQIARKSNKHLMIGYNRRFSPLIKKVQEFLSDNSTPSIVNIRINAEKLERNHWVLDPSIGGGRIIGEICHFIDLIIKLTSGKPRKIYAQSIKENNLSPVLSQNLCVSIKLHNGSIGNITYTSNQIDAVNKERVEILKGEKCCIIDDFVSAQLINNNNIENIKLNSQDKGQQAMLSAFLQSLQTQSQLIPLEDMYYVSTATFAIIESIAKEKEIEIKKF